MEVTTTKNNLSAKAQKDYELVQAATAGDQAAFRTLMERYRYSVYHQLYSMVKDKDDAEDLTLEAFGKAFNKLSSYEPTFAFSTWLFKIAINNCIDHIRKKRLVTLSIDDAISPESETSFARNIKDSKNDPEQDVIRDQKLELMRRAVKQLSTKYRTMIEMRYFEELSYNEIAEELNIPLGTVKAQLFRAKEMLQNMLSNPGAQAYLDVDTSKKRRGKAAKTAKAVA